MDVPLKQLIDDIDGKEIMKNTAALGASVAALGIPKDIMEEVVRASYPKKIAEINVQAAVAGYDACSSQFDELDFASNDDCKANVFMSGNEAVCIGAIRAGVNFFSAHTL